MPFALSHPRLGHQVCVRLQLAFNLPVHRPPPLRSTQPAPLAPSIRRPRRPTASPGSQSPRLPPFRLILRPIQPPKVLVFWPSQVPKILEAEGEEREKKKSCGVFHRHDHVDPTPSIKPQFSFSQFSQLAFTMPSPEQAPRKVFQNSPSEMDIFRFPQPCQGCSKNQ